MQVKVANYIFVIYFIYYYNFLFYILVYILLLNREMQGRIVALIGHITHDEITAELLQLNDELNNLFLRQQRYEKNRDPHATNAPPSAILGAAIGIPITQTNGN